MIFGFIEFCSLHKNSNSFNTNSENMQPKHRLFLLLILLLLDVNGLFGQNAEIGIASIYSDNYQGTRTTSGEIYDRTKYTCSHRSFQFGSLLRVTRTDNGKSVVVRVNDRGALAVGRVVDLSAAAAYALDMLRDGKAQVSVEFVGFSDETQQLTAANPNQPDSYNFSGNAYSNSTVNEFQPRGVDNSWNNNTPSEYSVSNYNAMVPSNVAAASYGPVPPAYDNRYKRSNAITSNAPTSYNYSPPANDIPQSFEYRSTSTPANVPTFTSKGIFANPSVTPLMPTGATGFSIQLGSFTSQDNLHRQAQSFAKLGIQDLYAVQSWSGNGGMMYKLVAGRFNTQGEASNYAVVLKQQYLIDGFVFRLPK